MSNALGQFVETNIHVEQQHVEQCLRFSFIASCGAFWKQTLGMAPIDRGGEKVFTTNTMTK
jgi:hypothetical protein